ncbi:hypothetical protein Tco_0033372 [Tanacetum coccineum]
MKQKRLCHEANATNEAKRSEEHPSVSQNAAKKKSPNFLESYENDQLITTRRMMQGIVLSPKFPGKFRGYTLTTEEEVEENEGLKEVWEKMEYVISDSDSDLESTASS